MLLGPDAALLVMYGVGTLDNFFYIFSRFLAMLVRFEKPVIFFDLDSRFTRNCWLLFRVI
jgi:hypothetical protein